MCDALGCWCRSWPARRWIFSTGQEYTVREVAPGLFVYVYLPATT